MIVTLKVLILAFAAHLAFAKSKGPSQKFCCQEEGFFRNPVNCHQFIRCVRFGEKPLVPFSFECPEDLVFDERSKTCNYPNDAPTCGNTLQVGNKANPEDSGTGQGSEPTVTESKSPDEVTPTEDPKCSAEGFHRDKIHCSKFYRCVIIQGTDTFDVIELTCPVSQVFNESILRCGWPREVSSCQ